MLHQPHLIPFSPEYSSTIASWVDTDEELERWCGLGSLPADVNSIFQTWHEKQGTSAYILQSGTRLMGYGELTDEQGAESAELVRVIINPKYRRRGYGNELIRWLLFIAERDGSVAVAVRIHPENLASLYCFRRMQFQHISEEKSEEWNQDQPQDYIWLVRDSARQPDELPFGLTGTRSGVRYCAAGVDALLAALSSLVVCINLPLGNQMLQGFSCYVFYLAYYGVSESLFGYTPGKWFWSLRVVSIDGSPLVWKQSMVRTLSRLIEVNPILLGGIPAAAFIWLSRRRQRLGGLWSNSVVVRNNS